MGVAESATQQDVGWEQSGCQCYQHAERAQCHRNQSTREKPVLSNREQAWMVVSNEVVTAWATAVKTLGEVSSPRQQRMISVAPGGKQSLVLPPHGGSTGCQTAPFPLPTPGLYLCPFFFHCQSLYPKDGSSMVLQNTGILPQHYMASQPPRPQLEFSLS
jgi:hypothetical protein